MRVELREIIERYYVFHFKTFILKEDIFNISKLICWLVVRNKNVVSLIIFFHNLIIAEYMTDSVIQSLRCFFIIFVT